MLHFSYKSGSLGIVNANRETFSLSIIYFYDEQLSPKELYLLKNIILHPQRRISVGEITLEEFMETCPRFSSCASGNFIALKARCYVEDADYMSNLLLDLISKPLSIRQEALTKEIELVNNEEESKNLDFMLEKLTHKPEKYKKSPKLSRKNINEETLNEQFAYTIQQNRPLFVVAGNTDNDKVADAVNRINEWLLKQPAKAPHEPMTFDAKLPYGTVDSFGKGEKRVMLFSSMPHQAMHYFFFQTLLYFIIQEFLFEKCRIEEGLAFNIKSTYRNTLYAQEIIYRFTSARSSKEIYTLFKNFFNKDEDFFRHKKQKVSHLVRTWQDNTEEYYQIAQLLYFTKTFKRADFMAEQIMAISYESFMEYYNERVKYLSIKVD